LKQIQAIKALRWNYKRRGVWNWLKGRNCFSCGGKGKVIAYELSFPRGFMGSGGHGSEKLATCSRCGGKPRRGYQRILSEPKQVISEQTALAEGVFA
jgi:DnaJ-class molecular chaperone